MKKRSLIKLLLLSLFICLSSFCFTLISPVKAQEKTEKEIYDNAYQLSNKYYRTPSLDDDKIKEINELDVYTVKLGYQTHFSDSYYYYCTISLNGTVVASGGTMSKASSELQRYINNNSLPTTYRLEFPQNAWLYDNYNIFEGHTVYLMNQSFSKMETPFNSFTNDLIEYPEVQTFEYGETGKFYAPSKTFAVGDGAELYVYNCRFSGVNGFDLGRAKDVDTAGWDGGKLVLDKTTITLSNYETYLNNDDYDGPTPANSRNSVHKASDFNNNGDVLMIQSNIYKDTTEIYFTGKYGKEKLNLENPIIKNYADMGLLSSTISPNILTNYANLSLDSSRVEQLNNFGFYNNDALVVIYGQINYKMKIDMDKHTEEMAKIIDPYGLIGLTENDSYVFIIPLGKDVFTSNGSLNFNLSYNFLDGDIVSYHYTSETDGPKFSYTGANIGKTFDGVSPNVVKEDGSIFYRYKTNGYYFYTIEGTDYLSIGDSSGDSTFILDKVNEHVKAENYPHSGDITGFSYVDHNGFSVKITDTFKGNVHLTVKPTYKNYKTTFKNIYKYEGDVLGYDKNANKIGTYLKLPDNTQLDKMLGRERSSKDINKYLVGWSLTEGGEVLPYNEILITEENYNNLTLYGVWADKYSITFIEEDGSIWFTQYACPNEVIETGMDYLLEYHYNKQHYSLEDLIFERDGKTYTFFDNNTIARSDMVIKPVYIPLTYTLTLTGDNLSNIDGFESEIFVKYGDFVEMPTATYNHRTIVKWQYLSGKNYIDFDFSKLVGSDYTLKAVWEDNKYEITYNLTYPNGEVPEIEFDGTQKTIYTISELEDYFELPNIDNFVGEFKKYYKFIGWKTSKDGSLISGFTITNDLLNMQGINLIAVYESVLLRVELELSYDYNTITFDSNFSEFFKVGSKAVVEMNLGDEDIKVPTGLGVEIKDYYGKVLSLVLKSWQLPNKTPVNSLNYLNLIEYAENGVVVVSPIFDDYAIRAITKDDYVVAEWGYTPNFSFEWEGLSTVNAYFFDYYNGVYNFVERKEFSNYQGETSISENAEVGDHYYYIVLYALDLEEKDSYDFNSDFPSVHKAVITFGRKITKKYLDSPIVYTEQYVYDGTIKTIDIEESEYYYYELESSYNYTDVGRHYVRVRIKDYLHYAFRYGYSESACFASFEILPYELQLTKNKLTIDVVYDENGCKEKIDLISMFETPTFATDDSWINLIGYENIGFFKTSVDIGFGSGAINDVDFIWDGNNWYIEFDDYYAKPKTYTFQVELDGNFTAQSFTLEANYKKRNYKVISPEKTTYVFGEKTRSDIIDSFIIKYVKSDGSLGDLSIFEYNLSKSLYYNGYEWYNEDLLVGEYFIRFEVIDSVADYYEVEGGSFYDITFTIEKNVITNPNDYFKDYNFASTYKYMGRGDNYDFYEDILNYSNKYGVRLNYYECYIDDKNYMAYSLTADRDMLEWDNINVQGKFIYEEGVYTAYFELVSADIEVSGLVYEGWPTLYLDLNVQKPYEWNENWETNPEQAYIKTKVSYSFKKNGTYVEEIPELTGSGKTIYIKVEVQIQTWIEELTWITYDKYNVFYGSFKDEVDSSIVKISGVVEGGNSGENDNDNGGSGGAVGGGGNGGNSNIGGGNSGGTSTGCGSASSSSRNFTATMLMVSITLVAFIRFIKKRKLQFNS